MAKRLQWLLPVAVFLVAAAWIAGSGRLRGDFRIDEAHKLAETVYLRHALDGAFGHPDWFSDPVERSNPAVGKFLFGFAVRLAGLELPRDLSVARVTNRGQTRLPAAEAATYREMLRPARILVLVVTAATAATVFALGAWGGGIACGLLAAFLYLASFLTQVFSATAVFDPLLTLFVTAAILPVVSPNLSGQRGPLFLRAAAAGVLCAFAFQTRLTGLVALGGIGVVLGIGAITQRRLRRALGMALIAAAVTLGVGTAVNPYYWGVPPAGSVADDVRAAGALPLRIFERYEIQLGDLHSILRRDQAVHPPADSLTTKAEFAFEYLFGDLVGLAVVLGIATGFAVAGLRRSLPRAQLVLLGWAASVAGAIFLWLPLLYPRYLLVVVPAVAIAGALGWTALARAFVEVVKRRRTGT